MERVADGLRYLQHREGRDAVSDQCAEHAPALEFGEQGQVACTERQHHECQRPVWKMERVADGLRYLQHREGRDAVSDQCAEHAPALEFGEQGQEHRASVSVRCTRSLPLHTGLRGGTLCLPTSARFRCASLRGRNCSDPRMAKADMRSSRPWQTTSKGGSGTRSTRRASLPSAKLWRGRWRHTVRRRSTPSRPSRATPPSTSDVDSARPPESWPTESGLPDACWASISPSRSSPLRAARRPRTSGTSASTRRPTPSSHLSISTSRGSA